MRILLQVIPLLVVACEHPTKKPPPPPPPPPELGGIRGLVTGGGNSPIEGEDGRGGWIERGPLAEVSIAIGDAIVTTDGEGRYERLLPPGKYVVRIDLASGECKREPDAREREVVVEPGKFTDVMWRCELYFK